MPLEYAVRLDSPPLNAQGRPNIPLLEGALVCLRWPDRYDVASHAYFRGRPVPSMKVWDQKTPLQPREDGWLLAGVLVAPPVAMPSMGLHIAHIAATGAWRVRDNFENANLSIWHQDKNRAVADTWLGGPTPILSIPFAHKILEETWGSLDNQKTSSLSLCVLNVPAYHRELASQP